MLVIKAEIWPKGLFDGRTEIARIGIINRGGSGAFTVADYNVVALMARDRAEYVKTDIVIGFPRHHGWEALASLALPVNGPGDMLHANYTESIVELLKRG